MLIALLLFVSSCERNQLMHLWLYFRHPQKQPLTDKLRAVFGIEMLILSCLVQVSQELFMGKLLLKQIF